MQRRTFLRSGLALVVSGLGPPPGTISWRSAHFSAGFDRFVGAARALAITTGPAWFQMT